MSVSYNWIYLNGGPLHDHKVCAKNTSLFSHREVTPGGCQLAHFYVNTGKMHGDQETGVLMDIYEHTNTVVMD